MENNIQYDSLDVAKHLIAKCKENNISDINNTKINKLLYATYGIYLAKYNEQITKEKPKFFPYGPVFPRVFKRFVELNPAKYKFDEKLKDVIDFVIDTFGEFSASRLSAWSHEDGSPWDKLRERGSQYGEELDNLDIYKYFKKLISE